MLTWCFRCQNFVPLILIGHILVRLILVVILVQLSNKRNSLVWHKIMCWWSKTGYILKWYNLSCSRLAWCNWPCHNKVTRNVVCHSYVTMIINSSAWYSLNWYSLEWYFFGWYHLVWYTIIWWRWTWFWFWNWCAYHCFNWHWFGWLRTWTIVFGVDPCLFRSFKFNKVTKLHTHFKHFVKFKV